MVVNWRQEWCKREFRVGEYRLFHLSTCVRAYRLDRARTLTAYNLRRFTNILIETTNIFIKNYNYFILLLYFTIILLARVDRTVHRQKYYGNCYCTWILNICINRYVFAIYALWRTSKRIAFFFVEEYRTAHNRSRFSLLHAVINTFSPCGTGTTHRHV